jgi:hypothetical protein
VSKQWARPPAGSRAVPLSRQRALDVGPIDRSADSFPARRLDADRPARRLRGPVGSKAVDEGSSFFASAEDFAFFAEPSFAFEFFYLFFRDFFGDARAVGGNRVGPFFEQPGERIAATRHVLAALAGRKGGQRPTLDPYFFAVAGNRAGRPRFTSWPFFAGFALRTAFTARTSFACLPFFASGSLRAPFTTGAVFAVGSVFARFAFSASGSRRAGGSFVSGIALRALQAAWPAGAVVSRFARQTLGAALAPEPGRTGFALRTVSSAGELAGLEVAREKRFRLDFPSAHCAVLQLAPADAFLGDAGRRVGAAAECEEKSERRDHVRVGKPRPSKPLHFRSPIWGSARSNLCRHSDCDPQVAMQDPFRRRSEALVGANECAGRRERRSTLGLP